MEDRSAEPDYRDITCTMSNVLESVGFEIHPFKIGWYNDAVTDPFKLDFEYDTLAFIVISTPAMFNKGFLPFLQTDYCERVRDPIDQCVAHYFTEVKKALPKLEVTSLHDFELHHSRRPKVLVQTAGHVAGACQYYQRKDVKSDPWGPKKKIFGVCVHPKYGGWFGLRGVIIFHSVLAPDLSKKDPPDVVPDEAARIELLNRFNGNWRDWTFRDIIPVEERYSELQKLYFATPPRDRLNLIETLKNDSDISKLRMT